MSSRSTQTGKKTATAWVVALTAIGSLMAALDTLVVSTSLSTIRLDLGASIEDLEWTVNAYNLSFAVLLITAAALGDRYGRRAFYAIGLGLFAAASAASALAPSVGFLIAARAVQGAGAALVLTLGLALLSAAFPPEKRGAAIGLFSAVTGIAVAMGPLVGGAIAEGIDWTWIFWLNVPIGLAAIPLVLSRIEESYGGDTGLDIPGLALISAAALRDRLGAGARELRRLGQPRDHRSARGRPAAAGWRSSPGSCGRRSRWCRCASSARAPSRRATRRSSSPSPRCSARSSSSRRCCRRRLATGRSMPACG